MGEIGKYMFFYKMFIIPLINVKLGAYRLFDA